MKFHVLFIKVNCLNFKRWQCLYKGDSQYFFNVGLSELLRDGSVYITVTLDVFLSIIDASFIVIHVSLIYMYIPVVGVLNL